MIDDAIKTEPALMPGLRELQTRFLYPFLFDRRRLQEATVALQASAVRESANLWEATRAPETYREGLPESVAQSLFPAGETPECVYLRLPERVVDAWFKDASILRPGAPGLPVRPCPGSAVELFLTAQGVGVLSLPLAPGLPEMPVAQALEFNHLVAHVGHSMSTEVHVPHPSEDQLRWAQMLVGVRAQYKPAPTRFAPLEERVGVPGGTFTFAELVAKLLLPLEASGLRPLQKGLTVYTVARAAADSGPDGEVGPARLAGCLAGQARTEGSAEAVADGRVLQPGHYAASSSVGAAQLLLDRVGEGTPLARVRDQFFVPYLLAYTQWATLQRLSGEAQAVLAAPQEQQAERLTALRARLLHFQTSGYFARVSGDPAVQDFYRMAQESLAVPTAWEEVRSTLAEVEAQQTLIRQEQLAAQTARTRADLARLERWFRWSATAVIPVSAAVFYHVVAASNEWLRNLFHWGMQWGELLFAAAGLGAMLAITKLWKRSARE